MTYYWQIRKADSGTLRYMIICDDGKPHYIATVFDEHIAQYVCDRMNEEG